MERFHYDVHYDNLSNAGSCSTDVKKKLTALGIPKSTVRRVSIVLYEAEMNMVVHANGGTVDVTVSDTEITAVVKDTGPGIPNLDKAMQKGYSTASDEAHSMGIGAGMGLANIYSYSDRVNIESTVGVGTTITMSVDIPVPA